jgi:OmpA-OmpF porin, OOP family
LLCSVGCDKAPELRGRIASLHELTAEAERNGAMKCAPRELALARAHTEFADLELRKGVLHRAEAQIKRAELNAAAAELQSPPEHCGAGSADRDGDGHPNHADKCPDVAEIYNGYEDADGCPDDPDTDGDTVTDSLDTCTVLAEDADNYLDEDGCPELDNDLDGILDTADKCPSEPEDPDGYEEADGCPDRDNDGDSVADVEDQCPNTPGQNASAPLGCPIKPALVVVTDCEVKIAQQIHFAINRDLIKPESYPILDAVVEVLTKNPNIKLEVQGHTDDKGSDVYNKSLSDRRAAAVRKYLVSHGISPTRMQSKGYGEERPLVDNDSEENRGLNRRVQFMRIEGDNAGCGAAPAASAAP